VEHVKYQYTAHGSVTYLFYFISFNYWHQKKDIQVYNIPTRSEGFCSTYILVFCT